MSFSKFWPNASLACSLVNVGNRRMVSAWSRNSTYHLLDSWVTPWRSRYVVLNRRMGLSFPTDSDILMMCELDSIPGLQLYPLCTASHRSRGGAPTASQRSIAARSHRTARPNRTGRGIRPWLCNRQTCARLIPNSSAISSAEIASRFVAAGGDVAD
jgi:hypothetical protein